MTVQNVQNLNPRAEVSNFGGYNKAPESEYKSESNDISNDGEDFIAQKLQELQLDALYSLLQAFTAETTTLSREETSIIERLMDEWKISQETLNSYVNQIQKNLLVQEQQQRVISGASCEKEVEIVQDYPLTKSEEKRALNQACVAESRSSWGSINPKTLVGKRVRVRMPGEDDLEEFIIKEYDSKHEMHRLEPADPDALEMDDVLSWTDIRRIPHRDIVWERGFRPKFDAPN